MSILLYIILVAFINRKSQSHILNHVLSNHQSLTWGFILYYFMTALVSFRYVFFLLNVVLILVFQDPSVQNAVSASQNQQQNLDDYNPFAHQQAQTGVAGNGPFPAGSQLGGPAPVLSTQNIDQGAPPPSYTATNQQQISSKDFEVSKLLTIADNVSTNCSKFLFMIFFSSIVRGHSTTT